MDLGQTLITIGGFIPLTADKLACLTCLFFCISLKQIRKVKMYYMFINAHSHTNNIIFVDPFVVLVPFPATGKTTGIPIHVFGTETHMTAIVGMALGHRPIPSQPPVAAHTANFLLNTNASAAVSVFLYFIPMTDIRDANTCSVFFFFSAKAIHFLLDLAIWGHMSKSGHL